MIPILLIALGAILFLTTGSGYLILSYLIVILLELCLFLFSGFIGLLIIGLIISYVLSYFKKH